MEPNKFEQHIIDELNKREIKPSATAWGKISNQLDEQQLQRKPKYLWWDVAASFTGLLLISSIYLNYDKTDSNTTDTIVDTDKESIEIKNDETIPLPENIEESQIVNTTIDKQEKIKVADKPELLKVEKPINSPEKNEITKVATVIPRVEFRKDSASTEKLIQLKIAEVIAKVDKLEQNDETVTDLEVDALILKAQQELLQHKIFRQDQGVDAMALLNEVESELDKPLKDQLFELLKKGIYETRNAIADRN